MLSTEAVTTIILVVVLGVGDALYKDYMHHRTYRGPNNPYITSHKHHRTYRGPNNPYITSHKRNDETHD